MAELVGKIEKAVATVEKTKKAQMAAIGRDMEAAHLAIVEAALHGKDSFSGWPKAPLIAKAMPIDGGLRFAPVGRAAGPERVLQQGRHAGMFGAMQGPTAPKMLKSGKYSKRKQGHRKWNGTTQGKDTWTKTVEEFTTLIPPKLKTGYTAAIAEVFG